MGNLITKIKVYKNDAWISKEIGTKAENVSYDTNTTVKAKIDTLTGKINISNATTANKQPITINKNGVLSDSNVTIDKVSNIASNGLVSATIQKTGQGIIFNTMNNNGTTTSSSVSIDASILPVVSTSQAGVAPKMNAATAGQWQILHAAVNSSSPSWVRSDAATVTTSYAGLVPKLVGGSSKFLRADGTWNVPNNTTYGVVSTSAAGLAPQRDGSTTKYLRADGTWRVPPNDNTTYTTATTAAAGLLRALNGSTVNYLRGDGTWVTPPNTNSTYPNAISAISRSGTTFTATRYNGGTFSFTQQDYNNTYPNAVSAISRSGTTFTATRYSGGTFSFTQQDTTYAAATTSAQGLMSATDKVKVNKIDNNWYSTTHSSNVPHLKFYRIGSFVFFYCLITGNITSGTTLNYTIPSGYRPSGSGVGCVGTGVFYGFVFGTTSTVRAYPNTTSNLTITPSFTGTNKQIEVSGWWITTDSVPSSGAVARSTV